MRAQNVLFSTANLVTTKTTSADHVENKKLWNSNILPGTGDTATITIVAISSKTLAHIVDLVCEIKVEKVLDFLTRSKNGLSAV